MLFNIFVATMLGLATVQAAIVDPNAVNPDPNDPFATVRPPGGGASTTRGPTLPPPICSYNGYWLNCSNFDSFSQLNFKNRTYREQELLIISPLTPLDLNEDFDLTGYDTKYSSIRFHNIKSFPFLADQTRNIKSGKSLYVTNSKLSFTHEGQPLSSQCDMNLLAKADAYNVPFFSAFKQIGFEAGNVVEEPLCPLLFKGGNFSTFWTKQAVKFVQLDDNTDLNVHFEGVTFDKITFSLDKESLSPLLFKGINFLRTYDSVITNIQEDFFSYFPFLKYARWELSNLGDFFRNVNPAWMKNANYFINVNYSDAQQVLANRQNDLLITLADVSGSYKFPDEDFCLFKDFPHHKMLFFQIDTAAELPCTCTLYWLHKHKQYKNFDYPLGSARKCFATNLFSSSIEACNFEQRLAECANPATATTTAQETTTVEETITHRTTTTPPRPTEVVATRPPVPSTNGTSIQRPGLINIICNNCQNILVLNNNNRA